MHIRPLPGASVHSGPVPPAPPLPATGCVTSAQVCLWSPFPFQTAKHMLVTQSGCTVGEISPYILVFSLASLTYSSSCSKGGHMTSDSIPVRLLVLAQPATAPVSARWQRPCAGPKAHLGREHGDNIRQRGAGANLPSGVPLLHDAHLDAQHALGGGDANKGGRAV